MKIKLDEFFLHIPRIFRQLGIPSHAIMILQNGTYSD